MKYYSANKELNEIYNISRISSIKISDTISSSTKILIPVLTITYYDEDNNEKIIISHGADKYFDILIKKITEVYNDEVGKEVLPNLSPFKKNTLEIDENTKDILLKGNIEFQRDLFKPYNDMNYYNRSILRSNSKLDFYLPVALYHLNKFLENTDANITFESSLKGYRENNVIIGTKNNHSAYFPVVFYELENNKSLLEIGNIFDIISPIKILIEFKNNSIIVTITNREHKLELFSSYTINQECLEETHYAYINGEMTSFYKNKHQKQDEKYFLPWEGYLQETKNVEPLENGFITKSIFRYYSEVNDRFIEKEFYSKYYSKNEYNRDYTLNEYIRTRMSQVLNHQENIHIIETYFHNSLYSNEFYKDNLRNKYFYHLCKGNIHNIDEKNTISYYDKDSRYETDIKNSTLVLKLIGGN